MLLFILHSWDLYTITAVTLVNILMFQMSCSVLDIVVYLVKELCHLINYEQVQNNKPKLCGIYLYIFCVLSTLNVKWFLR